MTNRGSESVVDIRQQRYQATMIGVGVLVWFIFALAVFNLVVGFAVATYLGWRHRQLFGPVGELPLPVCEPLFAPDVDPDADDFQLPAEEEETVPDPPDEPLQAESQPEKSPSELSIEDFQQRVEAYKQRLRSVDDEFRACVEVPNAEVAKSCLDSLEELGREHIESCNEAYEAFEDLHADDETLDDIRGIIKAAVERQTEQVHGTSRSIEQFDCEGDLAEGCEQMLSKISKLLAANDHLNDVLDEAMVAIARHQQWFDSLASRASEDTLTGLLSRVGLEAYLLDWWRKDPHRSRPLTEAMLDIDNFGPVNEQYAHKVGDLVLRALARLLDGDNGENGEGATLARVSGQRFVFLLPDQDTRFATNLIEQIRQSIETTHFQWKDRDIQLSASCAIVEVTADDTPDSIFARAESTIKEAKRSGRNRTFSHDGKSPTPVVPPNLTLQERTITL